ncbi:MAG: rhodanese-like domain-containing protein [Myxococcales bacterium]|nr:rhodanese-like domain-containing protein [Myxococcales bacterium]
MKIPDAPRGPQGFLEARPGDIATDPTSFEIIDVRETEELLGEWGHIHGVRHRPMARVLAEGLSDVAKDRPVVLVCRTGRRSAICAEQLVRQGFREVYNLVGGMVRWNAEERPVAKQPTWT